MRTELWAPGKTIVGQDTYNQFFTLHGAVMVFLVIIPGIPAALGNIIMPIQLGAPDVAFPRLNLASFYLWCAGALLLVIAIPFGGLDTGWTLYTPYSLETQDAGARRDVAACSCSASRRSSPASTSSSRSTSSGRRAWAGSSCRSTSGRSTRPRSCRCSRRRCSASRCCCSSVERFAHIGIFDPTLGGDPVLFQHFFWFYSHPAVYIMIIPAMGVISELISTFSRKPIFGYRFVAYSSVSLALLSFLVWGHHMFVSGQSRLANMVFSALTFTVGIPSAIKVFNWVATLYKGDIRLKTPMLYALSFLLLFTIGGLTGLFLGILSVDVHLHDTYFVVAHFHYVMMGSTLVAFLGALHYWWPKFTGRMYPETLGRICAIGVFFGFNLTFLPQFVMGARGMPRRYWDYDPQYPIFHQLSTIGAFVLGISMFITVVLPVRVVLERQEGAAQPVGRQLARVAGADAADALQLREAAGAPRALQLRRPRRGRAGRLGAQRADRRRRARAELRAAGPAADHTGAERSREGAAAGRAARRGRSPIAEAAKPHVVRPRREADRSRPRSRPKRRAATAKTSRRDSTAVAKAASRRSDAARRRRREAAASKAAPTSSPRDGRRRWQGGRRRGREAKAAADAKAADDEGRR